MSGAGSRAGFGNLLRRHRLAAGLTQEELAERTGLSARAIANLENGRTARPYRSTVRSLADALRLDGGERELLDGAARGHTQGAPIGTATSGHPSAAEHESSVVVPRQLPPAVPHFAGRADELKELGRLLDEDARPGSAPTTVITGTAGVGKTSLAVCWAHRVAGRFPDGQLYIDLRGFDPSGDPLAPTDVIRGFLEALGVTPAQIPGTFQAQAGLYRSLLATRRMLILLDNARDAEQVRPLLPGNPQCLVLVTSRRQLAGLIAAEGAHLLALDVLTLPDARELMARKLGIERLAAEPHAADDLIRLSAQLPLALAIAAARAITSPGLRLEELAAELHSTSRTLDALDTGEAATSLRAVFSWSYHDLSTPAARMFRLLGVHPGPDISAAAAASLAGLPANQSRALLRDLARCHLTTEYPGDRFASHDMLRAYAAERTDTEDRQSDRHTAIHRLLDHYLHSACANWLVIRPQANAPALATAQSGVIPETTDGYDQAMAWFDAEHQVLLAAVAQAAREGFDSHAWQLPSVLATYFDRRGYRVDFVTTQRTALAAAQRLGDLAGQARVLRNLGAASARMESFDEALTDFESALDLYRQLGDRPGQGHVYDGIAYIFEQQGNYADALAHCLKANGIYQDLSDRVRQANTSNNIGWCYAQLGDYERALESCRKALSLYRDLSSQHGQASTWNSIGYAHHQLGEYAEAASCHQESASLFGRFGDRPGQALALTHLGDAHLAAYSKELAREAWQQALEILGDLHHPDAESVRAKLRQLDTGA